MAPHLTPAEQDIMLKAKAMGKTPSEIFDKLEAQRRRKATEMVNITVVRRFLNGTTHKRGIAETRGRKRTYSRRNVLTMNAARRAMIKKTKGTQQVKWSGIRQKARVPRAHSTTVARAFSREGMQVKLRRSREKPQRTKAEEKERAELCGKMRRWPLERFTDGIDMIIDNKKFDTPATPEGREHLAKQKVVAQLRTRGEGLQTNYTKPSSKRHRKNTGGAVNVCAGISGCRVVLWEYHTKWNGSVAAKMYSGPIMKILKNKRGAKLSYLIAEDNDPSGYKSGKGIAAKRACKIKTIAWPRYSPDLMPLDFSLWNDISSRMDKSAPGGRESAKAFKARLRRTALRTSTTTVRSAVEAMRSRADQIWKAKGKDIARD